jgi:hypothetical protein
MKPATAETVDGLRDFEHFDEQLDLILTTAEFVSSRSRHRLPTSQYSPDAFERFGSRPREVVSRIGRRMSLSRPGKKSGKNTVVHLAP